MIGGGPQIRVNSCDQLFTRGQRVGRCRVIRRAEEAILAGTAISVRRMVAVVAFANVDPEMVAAARVRLNAMTASTSQAAFAVNTPEVIWGPLEGVHDVHDEGWVVSGVRRGCGYLPLSIRQSEGPRCVSSATGAFIDLGELVVGASETDLESFDFTEPAFMFGFGDARGQVVADLGDTGPLSGIRPVHAAPQAAVLVNASGSEGAPANPSGYLAALEMTEEFLPFFIGGDAVFFAGPQSPPSGKEPQVGG